MNFVHSRNLVHCTQISPFEKKQSFPHMNYSKEITTRSNTLCPFGSSQRYSFCQNQQFHYHSVKSSEQFVTAELRRKSNLESPYLKESYSTDLYPFHCLSGDCEFVNPTVYKSSACESIMQKERGFSSAGLDSLRYLYPKVNSAFMNANDYQQCPCESLAWDRCQGRYSTEQIEEQEPYCFQKNMYFMKPYIYKDYICETAMRPSEDKDKMESCNQASPASQYYVGVNEHSAKEDGVHCEEADSHDEEQMECLKQDGCLCHLHNSQSSEPPFLGSYLNCKKTLKASMIQPVKIPPREECIIPNEAHCSSAASIDSGFQSFHSMNTTYICFDINGVTLNISNICYNKHGQVIAMTVGFDVMEDSSEGSIFSDDEVDNDDDDSDSDDDDESAMEDDDLCNDSEEDFIVFDTDQCEPFCADSLDKIVVAVNSGWPSFEVKISQSYSATPYICTLQVDDCSQKPAPKIDSKSTSDEVRTAEQHNFQQKKLRTRAKTEKCGKRFDFENAKELNKSVQTGRETKVAVEDVEDQKISEGLFVQNKRVSVIDDNEEVQNNSAGAACAQKKKVHFENDVEVHHIVTWEYAYRKARIGPWKYLATNRAHFQRRIQEIENVIEPVLVKKLAIMNSNYKY